MKNPPIGLELHVPDFQKAIDFYQILGFEVLWVGDRYLTMRRCEKLLCFYGGDEKTPEQSYFRNFPAATKRGYGVEIFWSEGDIEKYYDSVKNSVKIVQKLERKPWGQKDFRIEDPFGFYLRIGEPVDLLDPENFEKSESFAEKLGLKI